jgi:hypothetical protein
MWTRSTDVAKREETPWKALVAQASRCNAGGTPQEREAHERMNPHPDRCGGRHRRKTITVRPKWRGKDGIEVTQQSRYVGTNKTLKGSDLHGRLLRAGDGT